MGGVEGKGKVTLRPVGWAFENEVPLLSLDLAFRVRSFNQILIRSNLAK